MGSCTGRPFPHSFFSFSLSLFISIFDLNTYGVPQGKHRPPATKVKILSGAKPKARNNEL